MIFLPPLDHEQCIATGSVTCFEINGITYFKCPCVAVREHNMLSQWAYQQYQYNEYLANFYQQFQLSESSSDYSQNRKNILEKSSDVDEESQAPRDYESSTTCEGTQTDEEEPKKRRIRKRKRKNTTNIHEQPVAEIDEAVVRPVVEIDESMVKVGGSSSAKRTTKSRKERRKILSTIDEDVFLQMIIEENNIKKKEMELEKRICEICTLCNSVLFIAMSLLENFTTRCYVESVFDAIKNFLRQDDLEINGEKIQRKIELGSVFINEEWTLDSTKELCIDVVRKGKEFDTFCVCAEFSNLKKLNTLDLCKNLTEKAAECCCLIFKLIETLYDDNIDMKSIPNIIIKINKTISWDMRLRDLKKNFRIAKIPEGVTWPDTSKIVPFDDIFILSGCTWGPLAYEDICKCNTKKGLVIYSSCCNTRQVVCKCIMNEDGTKIRCQNVASECDSQLMDVDDVIKKKCTYELMNGNKILELIMNNRTPVPQFNTIS